MPTRGYFVAAAALTAAVSAGAKIVTPATVQPLVVSTWDFGIPANQAPWSVLSTGDRSLDAGRTGAWAVQKGFTFAVCDAANQSALYNSKSSV